MTVSIWASRGWADLSICGALTAHMCAIAPAISGWTVGQVEVAILEWVDWFNCGRPYGFAARRVRGAPQLVTLVLRPRDEDLHVWQRCSLQREIRRGICR